MSTYTSLYYHIIFSTKNRQPMIRDEWILELHKYLGGTTNGLGGQSINVGGVNDHVHLLFSLRSTHCLADIMRELKKASTKWIRHERKWDSGFAWQEGYGAFTVSSSSLPAVRRYIDNQRVHHRTKTFHDEFIEFLDKSGVEYDPKYLI